MMGLLTLGSIINYLTRSTLGVAAQTHGLAHSWQAIAGLRRLRVA